jgi:hypothetical protein
MGRTTSFVTSILVALALSVPAAAGAQATRRGGGESSGGSGSDGGSTRSAPSAPSSGSSSESPAPRVAVPRSAQPRSEPSRGPEPSRPAARTGSENGDGVRSGSPTARPAGSATRVRSGSSTSGVTITDGVGTRTTRERGVRGVTGYAQARSFSGTGGTGGFIDLWYPRYYSGYGGHFGYLTFDPWRYGSSRWAWSRYGWYDPYGYGPYGFGPYGYDPFGHFYGATYWGSPYYTTFDDYGGGGGGRGYDQDADLGSIRLKVSPSDAKVYIDGALAGVVDDFDGLSNHLKLAEGKHQLEIRLDGYETFSTEIDVKAGRTRTERANLKRQN